MKSIAVLFILAVVASTALADVATPESTDAAIAASRAEYAEWYADWRPLYLRAHLNKPFAGGRSLIPNPQRDREELKERASRKRELQEELRAVARGNFDAPNRAMPINWSALEVGTVGHIGEHASGVLRCVQRLDSDRFLGQVEMSNGPRWDPHPNLRIVKIYGGKTVGPYLFVGFDIPELNQDRGWKAFNEIGVDVVVTGTFDYETVGAGPRTVFVIEPVSAQQ